MSDRYEYAINGIYKCEHFAEQVEQNRFPKAYIGAIRRISVCYFKCTLITKDDQAFLYPSIFCDYEPIVPLRTFFNVLKKDGSSGSMKRENSWTLDLDRFLKLGEPFDVSELLNPENECLEDDLSLSIEYGFQCDAIWDECWTFNSYDTVFNYTGEENQMVRCAHTVYGGKPTTFYCSPEIINFHCPQFVEQAEKIASTGRIPSDFLTCLQILHGVQFQIDWYDYFEILEIARSLNLFNVIQYCDRFCSEGRYCFWETKMLSFGRVINFSLRHILAEKLKNLDWIDVVKIAKKLDFKEATGEAMKAFVAKILYA